VALFDAIVCLCDKATATDEGEALVLIQLALSSASEAWKR